METTQQLIDVIKTSVEQESLENLNSFLSSTPNAIECFNSRTLSFLFILMKKDAAGVTGSVHVACALSCLQKFLNCDIDHSVWEKLADEVSMVCLLSILVSAKKMDNCITERSVQFTRDVLNSIKILADTMLKKMLAFLMKLAVISLRSNFCKLPLLALIRDLLQNSSQKTCLEILPSVIDNLTKLSNALLLCEDYETQANVVEILARSWIFIKKDHPNALFSDMPDILPIFNSLNFNNFNLDCRLFLNQFNHSLENQQFADRESLKIPLIDVSHTDSSSEMSGSQHPTPRPKLMETCAVVDSTSDTEMETCAAANSAALHKVPKKSDAESNMKQKELNKMSENTRKSSLFPMKSVYSDFSSSGKDMYTMKTPTRRLKKNMKRSKVNKENTMNLVTKSDTKIKKGGYVKRLNRPIADPIRIIVRPEDREGGESFLEPEIVKEPDLIPREFEIPELPLDYGFFHQPTTSLNPSSEKDILVKKTDSRKKPMKRVQFKQASYLDSAYIPATKVAKITKDIVVKKSGSRKRPKKIMKRIQFKQASDSDSDYITSTTVTKTTEMPDKYNKSARYQSKKMCPQKDLQSEENRNEDIASVVPPKLDLDSCLPPDAYEILGIDQLALEAMSQKYQESVASQGLFKISDVMDFGKSCISQIRNSVLGVTKLYNRERKMKMEAFDLQAQSSLAALQAQSQLLETVANNLAEIKSRLEETYKLQKEIVNHINTETAQLHAAKNMVDLQNSETSQIKSIFRGMGDYMKNLVLSFITNRAIQH